MSTPVNEFSSAFSTAFDPPTTVPVPEFIGYGPCTWPVSYASCSDCRLPEDATVDQQATRVLAESMASQMLWAWTAQRFGLCEITVRPCRTECQRTPTFWGRGPYPSGSGIGGSGWTPHLIGGQMFNVSCGACGPSRSCGCEVVPTLILPGPIAAVDEVRIDGATLDPAAYRVDNWSMLVRTDGGSWPWCQDMAAPADGEGAFAVTYRRGTPVPVGGQVAAGLLACEIDKALCRDSSCALPQRLQSITRQGVSMTIMDTFEDVEKGRTGIWLVDSWVASVNNVRRASSVRSPDYDSRTRSGRTQTWPR